MAEETKSQAQGLKYHVDIHFVVDTTGSMGHLIGTVKNNILKFYPDLVRVATDKGKQVSQLRIAVTEFKNYQCDGQNAVRTSKFFTLSDENQGASEEEALKELVNGLEARGGSYYPEQGLRENGLEALATAIRSEWDKGGDKRRHVIVLFTDVDAVPLEKAAAYAGSDYPAGMPATMDALTDMWDAPQVAVIPKASKRLCLFAPESDAWSTIANNWNEVAHFPAEAGSGLDDTSYEMILAAIVNSI